MNKVKSWLIKKLGGYTEQVSMPQPAIKVYSKTPVKLSSEVVFDAYEDYDFWKYGIISNDTIIEKLVSKIADKIQEECLYTWVIDRTIDPGRVHYRMFIEILPPNK